MRGLQQIFFSLALVLLFFNLKLFSATLVVVESVQEGNLQDGGHFVGSLYFEEYSNLASEVSGVIDEIYVKEGQKVKQGEKLALLNSDLLNQDIAAKEALLKQAEALLQKVEKDFERFLELHKSNSISFKEYEDSLFTHKAQESATLAIRAELNRLKEEKNKKTLAAPYDGVIISRAFKRGEWVSVGASVFGIAKLTPLEANIDVPYNVLRALSVGQKIKVTIHSKTYDAWISALIPLGDSKARTFPVKLAVNDPKGELVEGLEVHVRFPLGQSKGLLIPRDAILPQDKGFVVFVVRNGKALKVSVEILQYSGSFALIQSDIPLNKHDKVVVRGQEKLKNGEEVTF